MSEKGIKHYGKTLKNQAHQEIAAEKSQHKAGHIYKISHYMIQS